MEPETLFARGEWGVQTGWMHVSRRRPHVLCYRVVHLPSDCYVLGLISARRDAETIARWLHDEVPTLTVSADTPPVTSPPEAVAKVQAIIDAARDKMCVGARVVRRALGTIAARDDDNVPPAALCHCGSAACGGLCGLDDEGGL